jgi:MFS family permease
MATNSTRPVYRIQGLSAIADGAVLTTVVLYFSVHVGIAESRVGLVLASAAAVSLALAAPLGRVADRIGLRRSAVAYSLAIAMALFGYTLAHSLWAYAVAGILFGVARSGIAATIQAIVAAQNAPEQRVPARARLHTLLNAGFGLGSVVGAVALALARPELFVALFAAGALTAVMCAAMFARLRIGGTSPRETRGGRRGALRDRRLVTVTGLTGIMLLTMPILSVLLPVWLVTRTEAPAWVAAMAFGLNTVLVFLLQSRWSARVRTDAHASRSALIAGATIAGACLVFAMMPYGGAARAAVFALVGVVVLSVGEVAAGPAAWHLALRDTPAERQGECQAVFGMSFSLARILGPLAALPLIIAAGPIGWLVIAGTILAAGCGLAVMGSASLPSRARLEATAAA